MNIATGTQVTIDTGIDGTALRVDGQDLIPEAIAASGVVRDSFGQVGVTRTVRYEVETAFATYLVDQGYVTA